jgi:hypothetical protein
MQATSKWRAALNTHLLDDVARGNILAGILKVAPQSPLMANPSIAASVAALTSKGAKNTANVTLSAALEAQLKASFTQRSNSRAAFDLELLTLKALVENNATSGADITGMGFLLFVLAKASKTQPDAPAALVVTLGKVHGKARVAVQGKGYLGPHVAEVSSEPVGPTTWSTLPGTGKERKLSGYASGTKLWVRFAAVRFGMQSDWSAPALVVIP